MNIKTFNKTKLLRGAIRKYSMDLATVIHKHQQNSSNQESVDTYLKEVDKSVEKCITEIQELYQKKPIFNRNVHMRYSVNKNVSKLNFSEED